MNAKLMAVLSVMAVAFCILAFVPTEESDAASYDAQTLYEGGDTTITFSSPTSITISEVDNGYEFWAANPSSFSLNYGESRTVTIECYVQELGPQEDVYVTFKVNSAPTPTTYYWTINYDANGGTGAPAQYTTSSTSTTKSITISSVTPTRTNYTFLGWSTSSSASTPSYYAGSTYTLSHGTYNLKAVWQYNPPAPTTYTLTFASNNNSYGSVSPASVSSISSGTGVDYNKNVITVATSPATTVTATASTNTASTYYAFVDWSNMTSSVTSNRTITANFISSQYPIVTYDANNLYSGGSRTITLSQPTTIVVYDITQGINGYYNTGAKSFSLTDGQTHVTTIEGYEGGEVQADVHITFQVIVPRTLTFVSNNNSYGTVSPASVSNIPNGTAIEFNKNIATISTSPVTTVTATASTNTASTYYAFLDWSNIPSSVTDSRTITANFISSQYPIVTYDANVLFNSGTSTISFGQPTTVVVYDITDGYNGYYNTGVKSFTVTENQNHITTIEGYVGGEVQADVYITFQVVMPRTLTFVSNNNSYGTVSPASVSNIPNGTAIEFNKNVATISTSPDATIVTATASPTSNDVNYAFVDWSNIPSSVTDSRTITANFISSQYPIVTYDANVLFNSGTSTISFSEPTTVVVYDITQGINGYYNTGVKSFTVTENQNHITTIEGYEGGEVQADVNITFQVVPERNLTFVSNNNSYGTVSPASVNDIPSGTSIESNKNVITIDTIPATTVTATASNNTASTYYAFVDWSNIPSSVTDSRTITANFISSQYPIVTYDADYLYSGGSKTITFPRTTTIVVYDITDGYDGYYNTGVKFFTITENQNHITTIEGYVGGEVQSDVNITFEVAVPLADVWWDNGYINGSATIVFDFSGRTASYGHQLIVPILKFDGIKDDADNIDEFTATGQIIRISMAYKGNIVMTLTDADSTVHTYPAFQIGEWTQYLLKLDVQNGYLEWGGIKSPYRNTNLDFTFTDYNTIVEKRIVDFSNDLNDAAFNRIYHEDTGTGTSHPHFQVVTTDTYLDTYGVVMNDPVINIIDQFPDYDDLRLNLYSFAVYGDSLNINGYTMNMNGSKVRVYYTMHHDPVYDDQTHTQIVGYDDYNEIATSTTPNVKYVDLVLSNVYITWENIKHPDAADRMCYLTFVDANMTFRMGSFDPTDLTISFDGIWYFTTALWEPYQAYEKDYSWDYHHPFNLDRNGFILIFIAISVAVFVIMNIYFRPSFLDYLVVIGAGIIAYVMLGGM